MAFELGGEVGNIFLLISLLKESLYGIYKHRPTHSQSNAKRL